MFTFCDVMKQNKNGKQILKSVQYRLESILKPQGGGVAVGFPRENDLLKIHLLVLSCSKDGSQILHAAYISQNT